MSVGDAVLERHRDAAEGPEVLEERAMGMNGTPEYFSVNCFITHIRTDQRTLWYIACPNCKKKVQGASEDMLDGHCEKCNAPTTGTRRWIFTGQCNDPSGSRYVSFFDDTAVRLLGGRTADEMAPTKESDMALPGVVGPVP